jgi:lipoprotein NlpD
MALKNTRKKGGKSFWYRMRFKYKLSFFNENTLEEVWSFRMSRLTAFYILTTFALLLIVITSLIIIKTPIRNYLPGYLDVEVREEIMQNALRVDSLERLIGIQSLYLDNVTAILTGTMPIDSIRMVDSLAQANTDYNIPRTQAEEEFVKTFEEEEKYNLTTLNPNHTPTDAIFFYKPVNGMISARYEADIRHFGVDLVAAPKENVLAVLDGTVVYTGYDPLFGNVIQLQHRNGFLSVYKHNELLLKNIGDQVKAGEAIALIGNTGNLSTGPHLHFELWLKGAPVNPEEYITF